MFIGKHIFYYLSQPFCHKKFLMNGSESGRNHPLGAILRRKGAIKP